MEESKEQMRKSNKGNSFQFAYVPEKNRILVKVSHVNEAMMDFKAEVYDDKAKEDCHFVRILRVGPALKNDKSVEPGRLVIVHKSAGHYLERLSKQFKDDYYLIRVGDILADVDL